MEAVRRPVMSKRLQVVGRRSRLRRGATRSIRHRSGRALLALACTLATTGLLSAAPALAASSLPAPDPLVFLAVQQAQLTDPDSNVNERFGYSVAISGDTALVGAPHRTVGSQDIKAPPTSSRAAAALDPAGAS